MSESNEHEYMQSGQEALAAGEYNTAQVFFKQAIRVNNANEEAWLLLAKTYPTEPDKARKCYENVLKINPLNAEAQRMMDRIDASSPAQPTTQGPLRARLRRALAMLLSRCAAIPLNRRGASRSAGRS